MFCNQCGQQNPDDANFCNRCGRSVRPDSQSAEPPTFFTAQVQLGGGRTLWGWKMHDATLTIHTHGVTVK
jgi:hypothetical protein